MSVYVLDIGMGMVENLREDARLEYDEALELRECVVGEGIHTGGYELKVTGAVSTLVELLERYGVLGEGRINLAKYTRIHNRVLLKVAVDGMDEDLLDIYGVDIAEEMCDIVEGLLGVSFRRVPGHYIVEHVYDEWGVDIG